MPQRIPSVLKEWKARFCGLPKAELLERICLLLLAVSPLLQHYKSIYRDASTVLLVVLLVYFGLRLLWLKRWRIGIVIPLIAFSLYKVINHGFGLFEFAREALLITYFIAAASGAIHLNLFKKLAVGIAAVASILIALQYLCYYIFGFHLQLVATGLLNESSQQWVLLAQTGRYSVSGNLMNLYRPSAFFLEPSHMAIYCFPGLAVTLLVPSVDKKKLLLSGFLSLGIVLSTSGMGIAMVVGMWGLHLLNRVTGEGTVRERIKKLLVPKTLLCIGIAVAAFAVVCFAVPTLRKSILRIFVGSNGGNNAIMARMGTGIKAIKTLVGVEFWVGKYNWGNVHNWNMAGFFYTFYTQGLIGTLLSYGFYLSGLVCLKKGYFWMDVLIIGLSFVTVHTHASFFMLFYVIILLNGRDLGKDWLVTPNGAKWLISVCKNGLLKLKAKN